MSTSKVEKKGVPWAHLITGVSTFWLANYCRESLGLSLEHWPTLLKDWRCWNRCLSLSTKDSLLSVVSSTCGPVKAWQDSWREMELTLLGLRPFQPSSFTSMRSTNLFSWKKAASLLSWNYGVVVSLEWPQVLWLILSISLEHICLSMLTRQDQNHLSLELDSISSQLEASSACMQDLDHLS